MKLSVYLMREHITFFEGLLQEQYTQGLGSFRELPLSRDLPFECRGYVRSNRTRTPRWLGFIEGYFDTSGAALLNASSSFLLLLKAAGRVFAVSFGHGFSALDPAKIEPGFGLRVCLNALDDKQLRTLETRNIDLVTRQRHTHVSVGSPVSEFGLNVNVDWVRHVAGKPSSSAFAKSISGADSCGISCEWSLEELGEKCAHLLELYESDAYRERFAFIDHLKPLHKSDPMKDALDANLHAYLDVQAHDKLTIAYPEILSPEFPLTYRLGYRRSRFHVDLDELSLSDVYAFVDAHPEVSVSADDLWVVGLDPNDAQVTRRRSLRDYLVFETTMNNHIYLLSLGQWFSADSDYVSRVHREVAAIEDLSSVLSLPNLNKGEWEDDYNTRTADAKTWLLLDKTPFTIEGTYDKIEICDLLTPGRQFICVKKMRSSATLSHLFAQGSVSATLLKRSAAYQQRVTELASQKWPAMTFEGSSVSEAVFVFAIPTEKDGSLSSCMFFFSLVNLLEHARTIELAGFKVALCKINYA